MKPSIPTGLVTGLRRSKATAKKRTWPVRTTALGAGALLLAGTLLPNYAGDTTANWNSSQVASATLRAVLIPDPVNAKCTSTDTPLGGPVATVSWSPAGPIGGSRVGYRVVGKQRLSDPEWISIVEPVANSYQFKTGLLDGILQGVLTLLLGNGSEFYVGVVAVHSFQSTSWESEVVPTGRIVKAQGGTLNLISGFACR